MNEQEIKQLAAEKALERYPEFHEGYLDSFVESKLEITRFKREGYFKCLIEHYAMIKVINQQLLKSLKDSTNLLLEREENKKEIRQIIDNQKVISEAEKQMIITEKQ